MFYKGSGDIDVVFTDIIETVKVGDSLNVNNNPEIGQTIAVDEDERIVVGINTIDSVSTNTYNGPGITDDTTLSRPVTWCKQQTDLIINGQEVAKDRPDYEPQIYPTSYLIQPVSTSSTFTYVDNVRPLFNYNSESNDRDFQNKIKIISQNTLVGASATSCCVWSWNGFNQYQQHWCWIHRYSYSEYRKSKGWNKIQEHLLLQMIV